MTFDELILDLKTNYKIKEDLDHTRINIFHSRIHVSDWDIKKYGTYFMVMTYNQYNGWNTHFYSDTLSNCIKMLKKYIIVKKN